MNNNNNDNRKISTSRARPAAPHSTNPHAKGYRAPTAGTNSGSRNISRGGTKRKKRKTGRNILIAFLAFLIIVASLLGGLYYWVQSNVNSGEQGEIAEEIKTAPEFKGDVVNVLVLGLDWEEDRSAKMTDMIMYINFDIKNNKMNMLQIPRDTFVGEDLKTGGTGKINALYWHSPDKENPVNATANAIYDQLKLPVDYYVTIEMESFKEIVDHFAAIEVYVPRDMEYKGSKLEKGMRWLDGEAAEFFVRNRHGDGYARADLDRIEMQRYFYSGLFKRMRTLTVGDMVKLMPVFVNYVNTDMSLDTAAALGIKFLNVPSSNIMMCRLPVYGAEKYNGHSVVVGAPAETADLLNGYFRTYSEPVLAEELNLGQWLTYGDVADSAVKYMGDIDAETQVQAQE